MGRTACTEPQCLYKGALYLFYLPNTSLERYRYTSLISNEDVEMKGAHEYVTTDPVLK